MGLGLEFVVWLGSVLVAFFGFGCTLKERKLARGQVPQCLSGSVFTLHCIGRGFALSGYDYVFKSFFTVFCKSRLGLVLGLMLVLRLELGIGLRLGLSLVLDYYGSVAF